MSVKTPREQIDDIIAMHPDWRGQRLAQLRQVILDAAPGIGEDVKWKKPSRPEGVAVWTHGGNLCIADVLKRAVRLTFPNGASLATPPVCSTPAWTASPSGPSTSPRVTWSMKPRCRR